MNKEMEGWMDGGVAVGVVVVVVGGGGVGCLRHYDKETLVLSAARPRDRTILSLTVRVNNPIWPRCMPYHILASNSDSSIFCKCLMSFRHNVLWVQFSDS